MPLRKIAASLAENFGFSCARVLAVTTRNANSVVKGSAADIRPVPSA